MIGTTTVEFGKVVFDVLFLSSLRAMALILPVWLILSLMRPRRPALEHGVLTAVLCGMILLPVVDVSGRLPGISSSVIVETTVSVPVMQAWPDAAVSPVTSAIGSSDNWLGLAGLLSLMVTSILLLRSMTAWRRILQLMARGDAIVEPASQELLQSLLQAAKLGHAPKMVSSPEVGTPVVFGFIRPVIILPAAWPAWGKEKLQAVLLHELAHIARRDGWILAAAALNEAVFWFHPLARRLNRRLKALAETACDDHVILVTRDPEGYAETLLEFAAEGQEEGALPAATPAMAHTPRISRRIERILRKPGFHSGMLSGAVRRKLTAAGLTAAVLLSLVSPTLGQSSGITLSGSVQDASGARIPEAIVLIVDSAGGNTEATTTSADGSYRIHGLAPAPAYRIEVRARGFATYEQQVDLTVDKHLDITLDVSPIEEMIVVSGSRPAVEAGTFTTSRHRVGGNVEKAKLIHHVPPVYDKDVQREGVEGTVVLEAVISKQGEPMGLKPINTLVDRRLVTAAMQAVRQWRYKPMLLNGQPIEAATTISVAFQLP
ncbi:MAG: M56 family metallopeptidase [Bryobacterales bacterium]|nr:M56 family metallopeptidase [Bryobacterales bacterium]MDE0296788.1 M56 family metallopeptidase [Bryobacterales bacterium]